MNSNQALECIVRQTCQGELVFPTNMAAALRLQHALDDPDCHLDAAADMVLAEPLIAARLVAIANSVAYTRFGGHVSNVRTAVSLLGFKPLRSLVSVIVVRQLAEEIVEPRLKQMAHELWWHCASVAAHAKVLAREFTAVDPDTAMFAGIVHEIDGFYLLARCADTPGLLEAAPDAAAHDARARLSACMLAALKIPKSVAAAVAALFATNCDMPPQTAGDVLFLANALAAPDSPLAKWDGSHEHMVSPDIDFAVGEKALRQTLTDCAAEIGAITVALLA